MAVSTIRGDDGFDSSQYINLLNTYAGRNAVIDGNFDVWLEGTSQTTSGYGSDTMWWNIHSPAFISKTHSRQTFPLGQTDVPGNPKYFSRTVVTVDTPSEDLYCQKVQKIENVGTYAGQTVTLSFYAKADTTKNIGIKFTQNFGTGGTPSAQVSGIESQLVQLSSGWNRHDITVSIPSIAGKVLGTDGNDYLLIGFVYSAGSSNFAGLGIQSGTFDLSQVQLEKGSRATEFEKKPHGTVLAECHRYFYKSLEAEFAFLPWDSGSQLVRQKITLPTTMRAIPEVTTTKVGGSASTSATMHTKKEDAFTTAIAGSVNTIIYYSWEVDARL